MYPVGTPDPQNTQEAYSLYSFWLTPMQGGNGHHWIGLWRTGSPATVGLGLPNAGLMSHVYGNPVVRRTDNLSYVERLSYGRAVHSGNPPHPVPRTEGPGPNLPLHPKPSPCLVPSPVPPVYSGGVPGARQRPLNLARSAGATA